MDLRRLDALLAVAEEGSFSAAADRLLTVQSNVSTHVARLETELGVTLVDRAQGRLTEEGEVVAARARRIRGELAALGSDLAALRDQITGTVRLGMIGTTARWLVAPVLRSLGERHPGVRVEVLEASTTSLLPLLTGGRIDEAIVNLPVEGPDLDTEALFDEDLVVVAPAGHPFAGRQRVTVRSLVGHRLLLPAPGTAIRALLDEAVRTSGVTLDIAADIDGLRLLASLAFMGEGPAVLPATAVPDDAPGDWVRVPFPELGRRQVGVARRRRGLPSAALRAVREIVAEVVDAQVARTRGLHPPGEDRGRGAN